jgi:hypothetical protein
MQNQLFNVNILDQFIENMDVVNTENLFNIGCKFVFELIRNYKPSQIQQFIWKRYNVDNPVHKPGEVHNQITLLFSSILPDIKCDYRAMNPYLTEEDNMFRFQKFSTILRKPGAIDQWEGVKFFGIPLSDIHPEYLLSIVPICVNIYVNSVVIEDGFARKCKGRLVVNELYRVWGNIERCVHKPRPDVIINDLLWRNLRILLVLFLKLNLNVPEYIQFPLPENDYIEYHIEYDDEFVEWKTQSGFPDITREFYKKSIYCGAHFFCDC